MHDAGSIEGHLRLIDQVELTLLAQLWAQGSASDQAETLFRGTSQAEYGGKTRRARAAYMTVGDNIISWLSRGERLVNGVKEQVVDGAVLYQAHVQSAPLVFIV
jgi:hypothetical protein